MSVVLQKKPLIFNPNFEALKRAAVLGRFSQVQLVQQWRGKGEYFEIYEAYRPLATILRWLGMLPLVQDDETGLRVRFVAHHWITYYTIVPVVALAVAAYIAVDMYGIFLTNEVEKSTTIIYFVTSPACAMVAILASAYKAQALKGFVMTYQDVDALLRLERDRTLRRFGKVLAGCFLALFGFGMAMLVAILVLRLVVKDKEVASNNSIFVGIFIWMTYDLGAFTMPDLNFLFLAKTIEIRFRLLKKQLAAVVSLPFFDLSSEIESLRIAHHLLVQMAHDTNRLLHPVLLVASISNGVQILMCIYGMMLPQESPNMAWKAMKIGFGVLGFLKFGLLCLAGTTVTQAAAEVALVARRAPTLDISQSTKFEVHMLLLETAKSKVEFTASGYFSICLSFLSTIIGVIATYWIAIYQFHMGGHEDRCCPCNATYNATYNDTLNYTVVEEVDDDVGYSLLFHPI